MKKFVLLLLILVTQIFSQTSDEERKEKERTILKLVKEGKMSVEEAEILLKNGEKNSESKNSKTRYSVLIQGGAGSYSSGSSGGSSSSSDSTLTLLPLLLSSSNSSSSSSSSSNNSLSLLLPLLLFGGDSGNSLLPILLLTGGSNSGSLLPILLLTSSSSSESEKTTVTTSHGGFSVNILPSQGHSFQTGVSYGTAANSNGQSGWSTVDFGYTYFFRDGKTFVPFLGLGIGAGSTTGGGGGVQASVGKGYLETGFRIFFTDSAFTSLSLKGEYLNFAFKGVSVENTGGNAQLGFGLMF